MSFAHEDRHSISVLFPLNKPRAKIKFESLKTMKYMLTLAPPLSRNYRDILANVN